MKNIVFTFFCCCLLAISCLGATNSVKKARKQKCNIVAVSCKDNSRKYAENKAYMTQFDLCSYKNNYIFDATKFLASNASMPVRQKISNVNFLCHVDKNTAYVINTSNATICNRVNGENAVQENAVVSKSANNQTVIEESTVVSKSVSNEKLIEDKSVVSNNNDNQKAVQENSVVSKSTNNQTAIEDMSVINIIINNTYDYVLDDLMPYNSIQQFAYTDCTIKNMNFANFYSPVKFNNIKMRNQEKTIKTYNSYSYDDLAFGSSYREAIRLLNSDSISEEKKSKINNSILKMLKLQQRIQESKFSLK